MATIESLQAMLERQLIKGLAQAHAAAETEVERQRHYAALADLIEHVDPTLDVTLLDPITAARLERLGLWACWQRAAARAPRG